MYVFPKKHLICAAMQVWPNGPIHYHYGKRLNIFYQMVIYLDLFDNCESDGSFNHS